MSAADSSFLRSVGVGGGPDRIAKLDAQIEGLKDARRILSEAKRVARWFMWSGNKDSARHTLHVLAAAQARMWREARELKAKRKRLRLEGAA